MSGKVNLSLYFFVIWREFKKEIMKIKKLFIILIAFGTCSVYSQKRQLEKLTYKQSQDITFFKKIKNRTLINEYITANNNSIKIGDTLVIGKPTSSESNTRTNTVAAGKSNIGIARSSSRTVNKKTFEFIKMGRPAGFGSIMNAMSGEAEDMAGNNFSGDVVIVKELKAYHKGSKKKPLYVVMVLGEINGRAFGINKFLSVMNTELSLQTGEIRLKNSKMTREEAIAKLKESKELLDLDVITKSEYDILMKKLKPIITNKNK